jgi:secreted trypsin-like serine protease
VAAVSGEPNALEYPVSQLVVSRPGVSVISDSLASRARVIQIIMPTGYSNIWNPAVGILTSEKDDIAFLVLDRSISNAVLPIANLEEISQLKAAKSQITHLGYGLQNANFLDGNPHSLRLTADVLGASRYGVNHQALEVNTLSTLDTATEALCPGDSGGPWIATIDGVEKLVAISTGGDGCLDKPSGETGILGTAISPYLDLLTKIAKR